MTANEWFLSALKLAGWLRAGQTAIPAEYWSDTLEDANRMLKAWAADGLLVPVLTEDTHTLTAGDGSYTWGTGLNITTARPTEIVAAVIRWDDDSETDVRVISQMEYAKLGDKTLTGTPNRLCLVRGTSSDTIYLYPLPDAAYTLVMWSDKAITAISASSDTVACTGEMQDALVYGLAVRRRIALGAPVSQDLASASLTSKQRVENQAAMNKTRPVRWAGRMTILNG